MGSEMCIRDRCKKWRSVGAPKHLQGSPRPREHARPCSRTYRTASTPQSPKVASAGCATRKQFHLSQLPRVPQKNKGNPTVFQHFRSRSSPGPPRGCPGRDWGPRESLLGPLPPVFRRVGRSPVAPTRPQLSCSPCFVRVRRASRVPRGPIQLSWGAAGPRKEKKFFEHRTKS